MTLCTGVPFEKGKRETEKGERETKLGEGACIRKKDMDTVYTGRNI